MANKKISELPYIGVSKISGNTLVPLVTYFSATTGDTVHTYIDDFQTYLISGLTGNTDVFVTGGTYSAGTITFTNNTGGTFNVTGLTTGSTSIISGEYLPLSGGTVTGTTQFTAGLSANTISATTYLNLPITTDVFVTGGTYSNGDATFTNNTGGTFNVTGFYTGETSYVNSLTTGVGLSADTTTGDIIIINTDPDQVVVLNNGTNINVTGTYPNFTIDVTGLTDFNTFTTGFTYSNNTFTITDNSGSTFNATFTDVTGLTVNGDLNITGTTYSNVISATTYQNLPDNVTGNYLPLSGGTVSGNTIFTSGLTGVTLDISGNSSSDLVKITQTGSGNAFVVEDTTRPDSTPFVIDASGNTGIGTSAPTAKLDVVGGNVALNNNALHLGANLGYGLLRTVTSGNNVQLYNANPTGNLLLNSENKITFGQNTTPANWWATFFNTGNLVIQSGGTHTDAGFKLDVIGNTRVSGKTTTTNLQVTSGASAGYVLTAIDSSGNTQWIDLGTNGNELDPVLTITGVTASTINIGDRFLISGGTGIWSGRDNQIAEYTGAGPTDYSYYIPILDDVVFVTDTLSTLRFNGTSWIAWRGTAILQNGNSLTTSVNIGTNNARNLTFRTSGQTRMLISGNTGNVYIGTGTTLPIDQKLLVDGNIKIANSRYYGYSGGTGTTITGRTLNISHSAVNTHSIVGGPNNESITFGPSNRIFIQAGEVPIIGALYISPPSGAALLGANNTSGFQIINGFAVQANTTRNGIIFQQNLSWNGGTGTTSTSTINSVKISPTANMVTGTTNGNLFVLDPTINYTGGTLNLRGLYYNPTVSATTSAFTETAIETVRGNVLLNTLSGNTGIGTTTPSEKLDVSGKTKTTNLQVTSGATAGYVLTSDASGNASWQASTGGGTFTGGTVSGSTIFTNGLTANTISATTLTVNGVNITGDTYVTGLTFNTSNYNLTIGRNDGVSFTDSLSILASDLTVTGGTYNPNNGTATFTNNTGGTFNVTGFLTGLTDTFVTGGTYSNGTATFTNTSGGTFNVSGFYTGDTTTITGATSVGTGVTIFDSVVDRNIQINSITGDTLEKITTSLSANTIQLGINEQNLQLWDLVVQGNKLLNGGVSFVSGLTFDVSILNYIINGVIYDIPSFNTVTLNSGDTTYDRIDVFYVDINGNVSVLEGEPSMNPVKPNVDGDTQLEISFVLVPANATSIDLNQFIVYNEDVGPPSEWAFGTVGAQPTRISGSSTDQAYSGSTSIRVSGVTGAFTTSFRLTGSTILDTNQYSTLQFAMRNLTANTATSQIRIRFLSSGGTQNGNAVFMNAAGSSGFVQYSNNNISSWQLISIPLWKFYLTNTNVQVIEFSFNSPNARYYFDLIEFVAGLASSPPSNSWTTIKGDSTTTITAPNPNATLTISGGTNIGSFISGTSTVVLNLDNNINLNGVTVSTISATTYQNLPISGLTAGNNINVSGSNGNFTISVTGVTQDLSGDYLPLSGGTVTGSTQFTNGLSANTFSATTYQNLPDNVTGNYLPLSGGTVTGQTFFASGVTITGDTFIRDTSGVTALDTSTRQLIDSSGIPSVRWSSRLADDDLGVEAIEWTSIKRKLYDSGSTVSIDWTLREAYDETGIEAFAWTTSKRKLLDITSVDSVNWDDRILTKSDGVTISFDWENGILTGQTNIQSSTISATTYQNLPDNVTGNYLPLSGGTVTGNTTITANLTVSGNSGTSWFSSNTSSDLVRITQTGSGNAFVVEDSTNPDSTPFVITSGGSVTIGVNQPFTNAGIGPSQLTVSDGSSGIAFSGLPTSSTVVVQSSISPSIGMLAPDSGSSQLYFATPGDNFGAFLRWDFPNKNLVLATSNSAGKLIFNTGSNIEAARIDSVGNMGIGTTTPRQRLDVSGNTIISSGLTAQTGVFSSNTQNILTVIGSGNSTTSPLFSVQGSSGELFSVTDSLVGSLFSVNDISGLPIMEVFSDNTTLWGSYQAPSLNTTTRTSLTAGTNTIYSIPTSAYTGAFYEYTLISTGTTGARAGQIMSIWSGSTANFTEATTTDIGTTTGVTFTVAVSGNNAVLSSSATTAGWTVKTIIRSI